MSNSVESLLEQARAQQMQAAANSRDSALKSIRQNYATGVENVNKAAEEAQRQNYITKEMQQRNIGQQLAAAGLNGGAAETTILGLANKYGENRRTVDVERMNSVADLEAAKAQQEAAAQAEYNSLMSQIEGNYAAQMAAQMAAQQASAARSAASETVNPYRDLGVSYEAMSGFADDLAKVSGGAVNKAVLKANAAKLIERYGAKAYEYLVKIAQDGGVYVEPTQSQKITQDQIAAALAAQAQNQAAQNAMYRN
jgi:hypothetical protein